MHAAVPEQTQNLIAKHLACIEIGNDFIEIITNQGSLRSPNNGSIVEIQHPSGHHYFILSRILPDIIQKPQKVFVVILILKNVFQMKISMCGFEVLFIGLPSFYFCQ